MRIFNAKLKGNVVGGYLQGNITNLNCICHQILISPSTNTTQYDFQIVNPDDVIIFDSISTVGPITELTALPLIGTYTFKILNSTKDESFSICLVSNEAQN